MGGARVCTTPLLCKIQTALVLCMAPLSVRGICAHACRISGGGVEGCRHSSHAFVSCNGCHVTAAHREGVHTLCRYRILQGGREGCVPVAGADRAAASIRYIGDDARFLRKTSEMDSR